MFDQAGHRTCLGSFCRACSLGPPPEVSRPSLNKQELSPSHVNTQVNAAFILFGGGRLVSSGTCMNTSNQKNIALG